MIEVRESSDERKGPFFLFDSALEMVFMQGIRDRQLAEEIAREVNSQKTFTPLKGSQRFACPLAAMNQYLSAYTTHT